MGRIILRLDRVMADRKMSLNELSEKVGVANVNLSKLKNGRISAIRFSTLIAICEALNCQPGDLLEYEPGAADDPAAPDTPELAAPDGGAAFPPPGTIRSEKNALSGM